MSPMPSDDTAQRLKQLSEEWANAERRGDNTFLERTLADDFIGIGPRGFVLTKKDWLHRYTSGDLRHESFIWEDVTVHPYGDAALLIGRETEKGTYQGHGISGQFRTTLVWMKPQKHWLLAAMQLSPIAER